MNVKIEQGGLALYLDGVNLRLVFPSGETNSSGFLDIFEGVFKLNNTFFFKSEGVYTVLQVNFVGDFVSCKFYS